MDANGSVDLSGRSLTFTGAGRLQLGGAVTSLGTLTPSTGTVAFDGAAAQSIPNAAYGQVESTNTSGSPVTLGGNRSMSGLSVTAGELDVAGGETLTATSSVALSGSGKLKLAANSVLNLGSGATLSSAAGTTFQVAGTSQLAGGYVTIQNNGSGNYSVNLAGDTNVRFARVYNLSDLGWTLNGPRTAFDNVVFYAGQSSSICYLRVLNSAWNTHTFYSMGFEAVGGGGSTIEMGTSTAGCAVQVESYAQGTAFGTTWRSGDLTDIDRDNPAPDPSRGVVTWSVTAAEGLRARWERVPRGVLVSWKSSVERLTAGYTVLRRRAEAHGELLEEETAGQPPADLRPERFQKGRWQRLVEVPVEFPGGSPEERRYHWLDDSASGDDFEYRVVERESNGESGAGVPAKRQGANHD